MKKLFIFSLLSLLSLNNYAQKWFSTEEEKKDTTIQTKLYKGKKGELLEDSTGTHKIIYKFHNSEMYCWFRFDKSGKPSEDERGIHKKVEYWKYYKFYDKNGNIVKEVDDLGGTLFDPVYRTFKFDENGDLIELSYWTSHEKEKKPHYESNFGMIHKYIWKHNRETNISTQYAYYLSGELANKTILKRKNPGKTQ